MFRKNIFTEKITLHYCKFHILWYSRSGQQRRFAPSGLSLEGVTKNETFDSRTPVRSNGGRVRCPVVSRAGCRQGKQNPQTVRGYAELQRLLLRRKVQRPLRKGLHQERDRRQLHDLRQGQEGRLGMGSWQGHPRLSAPSLLPVRISSTVAGSVQSESVFYLDTHNKMGGELLLKIGSNNQTFLHFFKPHAIPLRRRVKTVFC